MKVIGTAGHIDHGKSALVHRLTGIDPDRLAEEKQRGMTIDLGFAWLTLPSATEVSIVDVPGHERFIKNMLAGTGGIDVALLVVAADEGVMPQTREHVDILHLLGVRHSVVALTKADLVEDDWLELVREEVAELLKSTTLAGSAMVPVSSVTGQGIDNVLRALDDIVAATPSPADRGLPYMPVDRVFSVAGFGTVLTGTLHFGTLAVGDEVEVVPGGARGRIRNVQTHRRAIARAEPGMRVAVNVAGLSRDDVARGDVLAQPHTIRALSTFAARLHVVPSAPFPLTHAMEVTIHVGAAERAAKVYLLEGSQLAPGEAGWARLRVSEPVAAVRGQRFIVRLPAPARTVAGGEVVDIVPRFRRLRPPDRQRLESLASDHDEKAIKGVLIGDKPRRIDQIIVTLGRPMQVVKSELQKLEAKGQVLRVGESYISETAWAAATAKVAAALDEYHRTNPLRRGMPKEQLRRTLDWEHAAWTDAVHRLETAGVLRDLDTVVAGARHLGGVAGRREEADRVLAVLRREPFSPASGRELLAAAQTGPDVLAAMAEEGEIVRVADGLFFARDAFDHMSSQTIDIIRTEGEVTVARLRDVFGSSRKYALAFLEYLDSQNITRRMGDKRILGSRAPTCA